MENYVKKLRVALRLRQIDFAEKIERSYASLRNYESGQPPPNEVALRMRHLAAEAGLADLAAEIERHYEIVRFPNPFGLSQKSRTDRAFEQLASRLDRIESALSNPQAPAWPVPKLPELLQNLETEELDAVRDLVYFLREGDPETVKVFRRDLGRHAGNAKQAAKIRAKENQVRKKTKAS